MTTNKLPQVDEAAPRRRSVAAKPAAEKKAKPTAPRKKAAPADHAPTPAQTDIVLRDQAERARLAREAALQAATPATFSPEHIGAVELAPGMYETAPAAPAPAPAPAPAAPAPAAPAPLDSSQLIVNQELVDVLKAVKGTSLGDFEKFLHELYPMMELWRQATTEGAARRHALSIMLLIKERF
ncbi:MAG: hypothetical protein [Bacteriophage sp.]|nr:MAG: hypothetical protein [Bacteriophage sp.]